MTPTARLIAITRPAIEDAPEITTAEDLMVYTARVSNPGNQLNTDTGPRLLRYCARNGHWSVFEQVDMTVEIVTSRAIAAQILRHRSFTFQEFSQRYSEAPATFHYSTPRTPDLKNRQASHPSDNAWLNEKWDALQKTVAVITQEAYRDALDAGVAKELARNLLPLGTETRLYMKGSVRSWIHYLNSRLDPATQKEHRDVAQQVREVFRSQFPHTYEALFTDG